MNPETLDAYIFFRNFEDNLRHVSSAAAQVGIDNGAHLLMAMMTIFVIAMGAIVAAGGMSGDRLRSNVLKVAFVIAMITEGWFMAYVAPNITDGLTEMISGVSVTGTRGDIHQMFSAMEGQIDAVSAKINKSATGITSAFVAGIVSFFGGIAAKIFLAIMYFSTLFYRMMLFLLMVYAGWMLILFIFDFTRGWLMGVFGQVISVGVAYLGVHVTFNLLADMLDQYGRGLVESIATISLFTAMGQFGSLIAMYFFCACFLVGVGLVASRIGSSMVPATGIAGGSALIMKLTQTSAAMDRAASAMVLASRNRK